MNKKYNVRIELPSRMGKMKEIKNYLASRICEIVKGNFEFHNSEEDERLFNKGNFNRWNLVLEFHVPVKNIKENLDGRLNCNVLSSNIMEN